MAGARIDFGTYTVVVDGTARDITNDTIVGELQIDPTTDTGSVDITCTKTTPASGIFTAHIAGSVSATMSGSYTGAIKLSITGDTDGPFILDWFDVEVTPSPLEVS